MATDHGQLQAAMQVLIAFYLTDAYEPRSWHWVLDETTGWFFHEHHPENAEAKHIHAVLITRDRLLLRLAQKHHVSAARPESFPRFD